MKKNIYETVIDLLKSNSNYINKNNELLKSNIYTDLHNMKPELIEILFNNETVRETFFVKVQDKYIFDYQKFSKFVESKHFLPDSWTAFENYLGLSSDNKFINEDRDVVLSFPHKDCVLEGGQTKEDQKRKEILYNEIIAKDEISNLLSPKVFTNAKRYSQTGEEENIEFNDKDNLIIKGNNLIALHSLLERYKNRVKCIYIDVPYNTGSDSFGYNDNFNHSTWLVFMKNRLETAQRLLKDDGVICIQCDDNEQAYLKVLCDEIFRRDNFINCIVNQSAKSVFGQKAAHKEKTIIKVKDYVLIYKNTGNLSITPLYKKSEKYIYDSHDYVIPDLRTKEYMSTIDWFKNNYKDTFDKYELKITKNNINSLLLLDEHFKKEVFNKLLDIQFSSTKYDKDNELNDTEKKLLSNGKIINHNNLLLIKENGGKGTTRFLRSLRESCQKIDGELCKADILGDLWDNSAGYGNINAEGEVKLKDGKKPEMLINKILTMFTEKGDLVLDFFCGSGTTCAVAHKMGRQYIGTEQIDNQTELIKTRLNNVINGDQSGISQSVQWQGGGSFVYCELK